jgi:hypothetical protein
MANIYLILIKQIYFKGQQPSATSVYTESGERFDHFRSYVCSLTHKTNLFTAENYKGLGSQHPDVFSLPEGTAQKPASPRKWSMRNSSYKSRARLILFTHHVKPSASIAFQSYNGLQYNKKGNAMSEFSPMVINTHYIDRQGSIFLFHS